MCLPENKFQSIRHYDPMVIEGYYKNPLNQSDQTRPRKQGRDLTRGECLRVSVEAKNDTKAILRIPRSPHHRGKENPRIASKFMQLERFRWKYQRGATAQPGMASISQQDTEQKNDAISR